MVHYNNTSYFGTSWGWARW